MASTPTLSPSTVQYLRTCTLLVSNKVGDTLDLSAFRIRFSTKLSYANTPNTANIRVYNLSQDTALQIQSQFKRVLLQAGYEGNFGTIFAGNVKQTIIGRESGTDTFIDILAGDGDLAYNFAVVNTTIGGSGVGASSQDQVNSCVGAMSPMGVTAGGNSTVNSTTKLYRGKTMYGQAKTYLRQVSKTTKSGWSIQQEKLVFIPTNSYLPGEAVTLNYQNGMIGTPSQTLEGVNVKCLLNPKLGVGKRIKLNNADIQRLAININIPAVVNPTPDQIRSQQITPLQGDGLYFVWVIEHSGDTRGIEWYSNLITGTINPAVSGVQGVTVGYD